MGKYIADNDKVVDTKKMELVVSDNYQGAYGLVDYCLYRTTKSHRWYFVEKSRWCGCESIDDATEQSIEEALQIIGTKKDLEEIFVKYPELRGAAATVIDE